MIKFRINFDYNTDDEQITDFIQNPAGFFELHETVWNTEELEYITCECYAHISNSDMLEILHRTTEADLIICD